MVLDRIVTRDPVRTRKAVSRGCKPFGPTSLLVRAHVQPCPASVHDRDACRWPVLPALVVILCFTLHVAERQTRIHLPRIRAALGDGSRPAKLVMLDMEAYRDLELTHRAFVTVLERPEFNQLKAGRRSARSARPISSPCPSTRTFLTRWSPCRRT